MKKANRFVPEKLPRYLHKYFWDIDLSSFDSLGNPLFTIQRLLDKGDQKAVKWVKKNFTESQIKETFQTMRDFSPKTGNFWQTILKLPRRSVLCLQTPYRKMRKKHWPY